MTFEVGVGDRVRTVTVVRQGTLLHVALDGHTHIVDARRLSAARLSLLVQNGTSGLPVQSVDASFAISPQTARAAADGEADFEVHVAGRATVAVQVRQAGAFRRLKKEGTGAAGAGPQRVMAPMPGKIVRVLVKAGDPVTAKQGLVVVEAMKMENELRAARDGRVRELMVGEGQSVDAGAVLLVVE
jgi:biotin carboxyl carrier protein